jgi:hypothetical protein
MKPRGMKSRLNESIPDGEFDKYVQTDISGPIIAAMKNFDSPTKIGMHGGYHNSDLMLSEEQNLMDRKDNPYSK